MYRVSGSVIFFADQLSFSSVKEQEKSRVRFQYDGQLKSKLNMLQTERIGSCTASSYRTLKNSVPMKATCDSFVVLKQGLPYNYNLGLEYEIIPGKTCDIVSEDLQVRMTNGLGLAPGE